MRGCLSPFLIFFAWIFIYPLLQSIEAGRTAGVVLSGLLILACVCGIMALWGVPAVGRVVAAIVGLLFTFFFFDECLLALDGELNWRAFVNRVNLGPIFGFLFFAIPCYVYAISGKVFVFDGEREEMETHDFCLMLDLDLFHHEFVDRMRSALAAEVAIEKGQVYPDDWLEDYEFHYSDDLAIFLHREHLLQDSRYRYDFPLEQVQTVGETVQLLIMLNRAAKEKTSPSYDQSRPPE